MRFINIIRAAGWMIVGLILCQIPASDAADAEKAGNKDGEDGPLHFKIGLLAPMTGIFQDFSGLTSASAVSIALDDIHADPIMGKLMRFSLITKDSGCSSRVTTGNAVKMIVQDKVDAIIGPPCSIACKPAAELASFFNKPIISWVATNIMFGEKDVFTTLTRTLGPFYKIGTYLVEILAQYNWKRVVVISSTYILWEDMGVAIRKAFVDNNITVAYEVTYTGVPRNTFIHKTMEKIKLEARIVFLACPKLERRKFMLVAHDLGMTDGDFVFFTMEMLPDENVLDAADVFASNDGRDAEARIAFEAVFHVTLAALADAKVYAFRQEVARRMVLPPWDNVVRDYIDMDNYQYGDKYSPFLYDAVKLYAIAINETLVNKEDPYNGHDIAARMRGKSFQGISGTVMLDPEGDREPDLWISDLQANGSFIRFADVTTLESGQRDFRYNIIEPRWPGGKVGNQYAPADSPACGFKNDLCQTDGVATWIVVIVVILIVGTGIVTAFVAIFVYRRSGFEAQLLKQAWRVRWEDIVEMKNRSQWTQSTLSSNSNSSGSIIGAGASVAASSNSRSMNSLATKQGQVFSDVGRYKNILVSIKSIKKDHIQMNRQILLEFNDMKDIVQENLNVFMGACIDPPNICLLWHYCQKGSLQDILQNDDVKLDTIFKLSFMTDIIKGMEFLHKGVLHSHGNLKSSNCVVDRRWTVKITDYGLPSVIFGQVIQEDESETNMRERYAGKLWTAPEILRENIPPPRGTQKGDVYSFAIICYEIVSRSEPYNFDNMPPKDVVNRIRNGESIPFRPALDETTDMGRPIVQVVQSAWDENPDQRPSFSTLRRKIAKLHSGTIDIMDSVLKVMEKNAANLEDIVQERTQQLMDEKLKTDKLLSRMLPPSVAEQLKAGKFVQPETYTEATIYISDIVGFTSIASDSNPLEIVKFLNDLYSCFDEIIAKHEVYKVETIGDAYMVVSGVPVRNGSRHVEEIANVSLDLMSKVLGFQIKHRPHQQMQIRIGLHSGPVVAGVVGNIMPRYCLFGDTVNIAARMESAGKPLRIHISEPSYKLLKAAGGYELASRGELNIKGKGLVNTYWLFGRLGYDKPLPAFDRSTVLGEDTLAKMGSKASDGDKHPPVKNYDSMDADAGAGSGGMPEVV